MGAISKRDIRKEVKKYIDEADGRMVKIVHAMLEADNGHEDWWHEISDGERAPIDKGFREWEEAKGIPHEEIVKKYPQWFVK